MSLEQIQDSSPFFSFITTLRPAIYCTHSDLNIDTGDLCVNIKPSCFYFSCRMQLTVSKERKVWFKCYCHIINISKSSLSLHRQKKTV